MDNGQNGDFFSVTGGDSQGYSMQRTFTISSNIVKGYIYRFKYRVLNQIGLSDFSDITYILAANVPQKPSTPTYIFSNSSQI